MLRRVICALALTGAMGIAGPAAARTDVPSAADLAARPSIESPMLAPDGKRVVARMLSDGETHIRITDLFAHSVREVPVAAHDQVEWLRWAGSSRLLLSIGSVERRGDMPIRTSRLAVFDLASGNRTDLHLRGLRISDESVIHVDRAGAFLLLSAQAAQERSPAVYRVDLASGEPARIVEPQRDVWQWYADSKGVVRAGVGSRGNARWMLYRADDGQAFRRAPGRGSAEGGADQLFPVAGSDQGYAIAGSAHGRYALFRYDFAADRLGALVYENPQVDIDGYETSPEGALLGVAFTDDRDEMLWLDPALKAIQARLDKALPEASNRIVSMSDDRSRALVWSGSATDPGGFYLFDTATGRTDLFARTHEAMRGKQLSPMYSVHYRARDGLDIPAYVTLPTGRGARGLPLIVMPHGGPFVRDSYGYDAWVQYLASRGYAVLQPNYRGSTGYGRAFVEAGDGQWGRGMQTDADDGVAWLAARGTIDARRVCIMGASYGGYAAMWAAARNPETYRCAISFAGISDVAAQLRHDRPTFGSGRDFNAWRARIKGEGTSLADLSPLHFVDTMTVPILIAHGDADDNVPLFQSQALDAALTRRGRLHEYVVYPGEGHGLDDPADNADFLNRVGAFLDRYNPS
jgi:dipeptidyl aminopeptidase/acylaminoacyl peptidase